MQIADADSIKPWQLDYCTNFKQKVKGQVSPVLDKVSDSYLTSKSCSYIYGYLTYMSLYTTCQTTIYSYLSDKLKIINYELYM